MDDRIVGEYLRDLGAELGGLPRRRRQELLSEIRLHIEESLRGNPRPTQADIRNVLDELGDPSEIAAEELGRSGIPAPRPGWVERLTIPLLLVGGVLVPVLGWLVAVVLLWGSRFWTMGERLAGTLLLPGGLLPAAALALTSGRRCSESIVDGITVATDCALVPAWLVVTGAILVVGVPVWTAVFLSRRLRRRSVEVVAP